MKATTPHSPCDRLAVPASSELSALRPKNHPLAPPRAARTWSEGKELALLRKRFKTSASALVMDGYLVGAKAQLRRQPKPLVSAKPIIIRPYSACKNDGYQLIASKHCWQQTVIALGIHVGARFIAPCTHPAPGRRDESRPCVGCIFYAGAKF